MPPVTVYGVGTSDDSPMVAGQANANVEIELRLLVEAIYLKYNHDFRDYSGASLRRRVLYALTQFDCATVSAALSEAGNFSSNATGGRSSFISLIRKSSF